MKLTNLTLLSTLLLLGAHSEPISAVPSRGANAQGAATHVSGAHVAAAPVRVFGGGGLRRAGFRSFHRVGVVRRTAARAPWDYDSATASPPAYVAPYWPPTYAAPVPVASNPTPIYVERNAASGAEATESADSWYYCSASKAYFPVVPSCPEGWQMVTPDAIALFLDVLRRPQ